MDILPENFRTLVYLGMWKEEDETFSPITFMYRIFVFIIMTYINFMQLIELFRSNNISDTAERVFLTLSYFTFYTKWMNITLRRKQLLKLRKRFRADICQPHGLEENAIMEKAANNALWYHLFYLRMATICGVCLALRPFARLGMGPLELPFKTYQLFDESNPVYFPIIFVVQGVGVIHSSMAHSCLDTLCYGFMIRASGQFELCCHRLISCIESGKLDLYKEEWIKQHIYAYNTVHEIEVFFIGVMVVYFGTSLFSLCTSVFQISQFGAGRLDFLLTLVYIVAVLFEIFLYCYHGTVLKQTSQRIMYAAYESDWTKLTPRNRRILQFMMMMSHKGSIISFRGQCPLYLSTFVWIMKSSYGAFNLLQTVSFD